jgi:hypothetical protein
MDHDVNQAYMFLESKELQTRDHCSRYAGQFGCSLIDEAASTPLKASQLIKTRSQMRNPLRFTPILVN